MLPYSFIFLMTIMGAVASLFLKNASGSLKGDSAMGTVLNLLKTPSLYIGGKYLCVEDFRLFQRFAAFCFYLRLDYVPCEDPAW